VGKCNYTLQWLFFSSNKMGPVLQWHVVEGEFLHLHPAVTERKRDGRSGEDVK
jgi:hypothetical protein